MAEAEAKKTIVIDKKIVIVAVVIVVVIVVGWFFFSINGKAEYIQSDSPMLGNPNATVSIIVFSDFECPYCEAAEGVNQQIIDSLKQQDPTWEAPVPNIINEYVNTGKVNMVFRQYPLPIHLHATDAALASKCAQDQGKFWEYHDILFKNYESLGITDLKRYAVDLNLNVNQFNQCLDSKKYQDSIQRDVSDGQALGVSGTPTFFIGNNATGYVKIEGAVTFSAFKKDIDSMLP
jgi:protein-disulfide isomerase